MIEYAPESLRQKVRAIVQEIAGGTAIGSLEQHQYGAIIAKAADRILALPEIADALALHEAMKKAPTIEGVKVGMLPTNAFGSTSA